MNDFEKILKDVEERLQGVELKIKKKLDSIDRVVNDKLKAHGFGWDDDDDETDANGADMNGSGGYNGADEASDGYAQTAHTAGAEANGGVKYSDVAKKLEEIAPFMDKQTLHNLVGEFLYGELEMNMTVVLPFLDEGDISLIMKKLLKCEGETFKGLKVKDLLPFADDKDIDELFIKRAKAGHIDRDMMPFVSKNCWHEIVKDYCRDEDSTLNIDEFYPYLDDNDIQLLFKTYLKRQKKHRIK